MKRLADWFRVLFAAVKDLIAALWPELNPFSRSVGLATDYAWRRILQKMPFLRASEQRQVSENFCENLLHREVPLLYCLPCFPGKGTGKINHL